MKKIPIALIIYIIYIMIYRRVDLDPDPDPPPQLTYIHLDGDHQGVLRTGKSGSWDFGPAKAEKGTDITRRIFESGVRKSGGLKKGSEFGK